jgi:ureidoacrylate peracid hydrolase
MTQPLSREIDMVPAHTTLLFVDVQNYNCTWEGGEYAQLDAAEKERQFGYFFRTLKDSALPNIVLLQQACRRAGIEVTCTIVESLTACR